MSIHDHCPVCGRHYLPALRRLQNWWTLSTGMKKASALSLLIFFAWIATSVIAGIAL